jgi:hypothetical protein
MQLTLTPFCVAVPDDFIEESMVAPTSDAQAWILTSSPNNEIIVKMFVRNDESALPSRAPRAATDVVNTVKGQTEQSEVKLFQRLEVDGCDDGVAVELIGATEGSLTISTLVVVGALDTAVGIVRICFPTAMSDRLRNIALEILESFRCLQ